MKFVAILLVAALAVNVLGLSVAAQARGAAELGNNYPATDEGDYLSPEYLAAAMEKNAQPEYQPEPTGYEQNQTDILETLLKLKEYYVQKLAEILKIILSLLENYATKPEIYEQKPEAYEQRPDVVYE